MAERGLLLVLTALGAALLLASLLGRMLDFGIRRDEMLFVAPAALLENSRLYSDFFYNHVPYSAWLFRGANLLAGDLGILASARLTVFAAWLVLLGVSAWGVWRLSRSAWLAAFSFVALVTNETLLDQAGMAASNNLLPLAAAAVGIALFLVAVVERGAKSLLMVGLSGLALSVALGLKVSAIAFALPLGLAAFFVPARLTFRDRLRTVVLPMLVGGLLGALPVFWLVLQDAELFFAHVLSFHTGPHVAYWEAFAHTEPTLAIGFGGKLLLAFGAWLSGSALLLAFGVVFCAALVLKAGGHRASYPESGGAIVAMALVATTALMSFIPTPGFPQYYAAPLVAMPFLAALLLRMAGEDARRLLAPAIPTAMLLMIVLAVPRLAPGFAALVAPGQTEVAQISKGGAEIRAALAAEGVSEGPIATFMPLYPLEAGLPVYPELATGQFGYRSAEFTPGDLAPFYVQAGPDDMVTVFENDPPAAFLLGYEPQLEGVFRAWADAHGYRAVEGGNLENRYGAGILMLPNGEGGS